MDALTLTPSLRAAETCNLANHRYVPLQGGQGYATNGRWVNHHMENTSYCKFLRTADGCLLLRTSSKGISIKRAANMLGKRFASLALQRRCLRHACFQQTALLDHRHAVHEDVELDRRAGRR